MIARDVAKQIIKENTGQEPNDGQITKAEMLIVAFANEYHKALQPTYSTKLSMPDVGQTFYCHRKKWLKEEGCRWQCNECIEDAKKYGQ